ncbi:MAG: hypothetical protein MUC88_11730 [Planctomycetes bacterium]|jgi:hypothetical protein|nr:hypothetical protein [Planctomycetota bacterium]
MPDQVLVNPAALEPLFSPWEEPAKHRIRGDKPGEPAKIVNGRRPSPVVIAHNLRWAVKEWRESFYGGASDTTRELLNHWFNRSHRGKTAAGEEFEFHYYFHHLRESNSPLTRHFVVVAPNLTVYERLKEDFGDGRIFDTDPLIPAEWRGDCSLSIVLQDEAAGADTVTDEHPSPLRPGETPQEQRRRDLRMGEADGLQGQSP